MKLKNNMDKQLLVKIFCCVMVVFVLVLGFLISRYNDKSTLKTKKVSGIVTSSNDGEVTIQDKDNTIYTFQSDDFDFGVGSNVAIKYSGILSHNKCLDDCKVTDYEKLESTIKEDDIPSNWQDNGIFSQYYKMAYNDIKNMSLDEKIGQLLLVRYPDSGAVNDLNKYHFAGFVFFEKDFKNKNKQEVVNMIQTLQKNSKVPLLTAVDEEGGSVVRVSSNPLLASQKFSSPRQLYAEGGFNKIKEDTINKSNLLNSLGLNLNLAPVVDVSTNSSDYMYSRSLGEDTATTSTYAKTVIEASKNTGVSYTLKHFPGYGNNNDTHTGSATDSRSYDDILTNDIPPFEAGIKSGAEAVLISHNIVSSIDKNNPASLSTGVHNLLRSNLNFTGIVITDDMAMGAVSSLDNVYTKAILAGNDLIITTDYVESFNEIKGDVSNGTISEDLINKLAFRVMAWKYYKGLMLANQK